MNATESRALELLRTSLGKSDATFHEHQWESISTLVEKRSRLLVVQRTGWGKSAVYFIATKLMREQGYGPTIIISPLLALMRNQIESAAGYGVRLGTINSSNTDEQNGQTRDSVVAGELDAIIISPEQLAKPSFNEEVLLPISDRIGLFVIDEAHCISDWGHDFRPDYKRIVNILPFLPVNMPVLATTATANQRVMNDVCNQLGDDIQVFRGELTRESLHLQAIDFPKRSHRLAWLAEILPQLEGTGIIYATTKRDAQQVAEWLTNQGINVYPYHAGEFPGMSRAQSSARRLELEEALLNDQVKALVATSALGMGYDKSDLAFVIHYQSPGSVVSYYQQVGRAGRQIPKAYGILLSGSEDDDIQRYFIRQAFPREALVNGILEVLEASEDGLKTAEVIQRVNGTNKKIDAALKYLTAESPAPVMVAQQSPIIYARTTNAYQLPHEAITRLSQIKEAEWETMQAYVHHDGCLMQFLSNELDDPHASPCGKCANCNPEESVAEAISHEMGQAAADFLENVLIEIEPRKQVTCSDFPVYQFPRRLAAEGLLHEPGRALSRWGEAGWGEIAKAGKEAGAFDPRLAIASAKLIRKRWHPDPVPGWVTFVPSQRNQDLVANFAQQLADQLGIPCIDTVKKVRNNRQQKFMENTNFRCANLDGVFAIEPDISDAPVLLVDDAFDSRWTFTVIAALLLRAGSGSVFPFAIMDTSTSD
ncbi:MAG: ATP-dependent DNA helicase RecG [Gammaproteobacteria bacterium]|nr:MAG: ATP-dependent DNA helicase RecG [Gammaproteobacteria bacterium]